MANSGPVLGPFSFFGQGIWALGMDVDGRSRLICRYVRPQRPPEHIAPENPFATEMAARYVALVPSLQDNEMWNVDDLWCSHPALA